MRLGEGSFRGLVANCAVQLTKLISDTDSGRAKRAFEAMMQMKRIDIAALELAAKGAGRAT